MGKKLLLALSSILLLSVFTATAGAKVGLELRGGLALISPTEYNEGVLYVAGSALNGFGFTNALVHVYSDNTLSGYNNLPSDTVGSSIAQMADGTAMLSLFLGDSFAIKLRGDMLYTDYDDIATIDGIDCLYSETHVISGYIGAGPSYYMNLSPNLAFFLSADGGMFLNLESYYQIGSFSDASEKLNDINLPQGAYSVDFTDSFFGGHAEAGAQLLFSEAIGVSLYGGYRYAKMPVTFPDSGAVNLVDADGNTIFTKAGIFSATELDISGAYFGGGLVFYFGADKLAAAGAGTTSAAAADSGKISQYEKYGDQYFKKKNYSYALKYYKGAMKLSANNGLYKKIGLCYYYTQDMQNAYDNIKKYMDTNPNDPAMVKWLEALQKKLGM